MRRENGSIIGVDNTPTTSVAAGVWSLFEHARYQKEGVWPTFVAGEPYFNYTTLLLHGDGTNGAQNNTFLDSSTNNFTITRNGNTTQGTFSPFSQTGWSNYFDGSGDDLTTPSNAAFTYGTGDFCVECWCYFTGGVGGSGYSYVFGQGASTGSSSLGLYIQGGVYKVWNGSAVITGTATFAQNTWVHLAITRSGTTLRLFVNGVQDGSATNSNSISTGTTTGISIGRWSEIADTNYITGYVSNFRVVKGTAVYTSAFTPPTAPLNAISGTSLLTCQSNRFRDASTNNFAITVNGNTSVQAFSPFAPSAAYSAATVGGSGYFDGSGDSLAISYNSAFNYSSSSPFTCEFFFYPTAGGSDNYQLAASQNGGLDSNLNWLFRQTSANKVRFVMIQSGGTVVVNDTTDTFNVNGWNHIAAVMTGSATKLWLNGVYQGSVAFNGSQQVNGNISIGVWTTHAVGYISNFRFVANTQVYTGTSNITVPTAPLTAISGTSLLLNFTNGGIIDNTAKNVLETVGNAQISTSVKKYGTGSLAFDGTGDYLQFAQGITLSGDFTVEAWIYPTVASQKPEVWQRGGLISDFVVSTNFNAADAGVILGEFTPAGSGYSSTAGSTALTQNAWNHVAWCRSGGTITMYLNGTSVGTVSTSANSQILGRIGAFGGTTYDFSGYIDDMRITQGVARYTTTFTPPTAAFADQ